MPAVPRLSARLDHGVAARRPRDGRQLLADALDEGVVAAARRTARRRPAAWPAPAAARAARFRPHSRFSASSTVAASELPPPMPAPQGTFFSTEMSAPSVHAAGLLQRAGGAQAQVVGGQRGAEVVAAQQAVVAALDVQRVGPVDQHEDRLQQVVAVGAPPGDVQEQVQLGRRRQVVERFDGHGVDQEAEAADAAGSAASSLTRTCSVGARQRALRVDQPVAGELRQVDMPAELVERRRRRPRAAPARAGPRTAGQPVEHRRQRQLVADRALHHLLERRVVRGGAVGLELDLATARPACRPDPTSAPARPSCRSGW